jgi:hypothetical protein
MKKIFILILLGFIINTAYATHDMAGDISYMQINGNTYLIIIRTFTNTNPATTQADRCELIVNFGDGDSAIAPRVNGLSTLCTSRADGELIAPYIKKNVYEIVHTYSGNGTYIVSVEDPSRVQGECNIPNSVDASFYLQATIILNSFSVNHSGPQYTGIPLVADTVGVISHYNPLAVDSDGDSLSYELTTPMSNALPILGYTTPPTSNSFSIDSVTGTVTWNTPTMICNYTYAIKITEWRIVSGNAYNIGNTMQEVWNQNAALELTSVQELNQKKLVMNVYPNPSIDIVNLSVSNGFDNEQYQLNISNALGEHVRTTNFTGNTNVLSVTGLDSGIYFYTLSSSRKEFYNGKFIVLNAASK